MTYRVRPGHNGDIPLLGAIEAAAARRFADQSGLETIAGGRPTSEAGYQAAIAEARLWVVVAPAGGLAALAIADMLDGQGYLAEVSVHPDHAGHRLAVDLIAAVEDWASASGASALRLTTFRDVPWNRPYYERLGFRVLPEAEAGPQLRAIRQGERDRGLDALSPRVCMKRRIGERAA